MAEMTCNEFIKSMRHEFGCTKFWATDGKQVIERGHRPDETLREMFIDWERIEYDAMARKKNQPIQAVGFYLTAEQAKEKVK